MLNNKKTEKILGVDPGFDRIGLAIVCKENQKEKVLFSDCINTNRKDDFYSRLFYLTNEVEKTILLHKPDTLAIESLFFQNNKTTAMKVAEARGAILFIAKLHNLIIKEINPNSVKACVTGNGKATKQEVIKMIGLTTGITQNKKDDEYDAIAVAIAGFYY